METKVKALERQVKSLQRKRDAPSREALKLIANYSERLSALELSTTMSVINKNLGQVEAETLIKERVVRQMRDQGINFKLSFLFAESKATYQSVGVDSDPQYWTVKFPGNMTKGDKVTSGVFSVIFSANKIDQVLSEMTIRFLQIDKIKKDGDVIFSRR